MLQYIARVGFIPIKQSEKEIALTAPCSSTFQFNLGLFCKADLFWCELFGNTSKSFVQVSPKLKKREKSWSQ